MTIASRNISTYSTTPIENATSASGFPEGMLHAEVNDGVRSMQADLRGSFEELPWFEHGDTIAYVSATSFSVSGDRTATYAPGRRVRADGSTTGTVTGRITSSLYTTLTTVTVLWDSGALQNEALRVWVATGKVLDGSEFYVADSGVANAYAVTAAASALTAGLRIWFKAANANTGAATLNVNGLGAKSIVKNVADALEAGDIAANQVADVIYDGSNFVLQNPPLLNVASLRRGKDDAEVQISGGSTVALGGNVVLYGEDHATLAKDIHFRSGTDIKLLWDDSDDHFDFNGNDITEVGSVKYADGSTQTGANGQWQLSYVTAATSITTTFPHDDTTPQSSEGQEIAKITGVVVAAGEQVEIHYEAACFGNDQSVALVLFRDSTCLDTVIIDSFASTDAAFKGGTIFIDDDPGADTYTYSVRIGSLGSTSGTYYNARNNSGGGLFNGKSRSGLKLRIIK